MSKLAKLAGTLPFAHLLGVKAARAEEDKSKDDEDDKDKAKKAKAEDDESDDQAKKAKAEEDDTDKKPEDEESPKCKKAKAESDDSDDDEDEKDKAKAARLNERARCAAIMAHGIQAGAVRQAGILAFQSDMDASLAIASLDASAADHDKPASTLASRMQSVQQTPVRPDGGAAAEGPAAVAQAILAAAAKARGRV